MNDSPLPPFPNAADLGAASEAVVAGRDVTARNVTLFTNIGDYNPPFAEHLARDIYVDRRCSLAPVHLVRMVADTVVVGGGTFLVRSVGQLIAEQVAPQFRTNPAEIEQIVAKPWPEIEIAEEAVILVRYGVGTWGHWLGELLPRAVVAEHCHPGRFRYIVPYAVVSDDDPRRPWIRMRESLAAYGVGPDRLIPVNVNVNIRLRNGYIVSSVWSDRLIHPAVAEWMRCDVRLGEAVGESATLSRLAISRHANVGREISNDAEIAAVLLRQGFVAVDVGRLSFASQVNAFQSADMVFSVLGSGLSGLLYAPSGVRVVSAAPHLFGDRFFYALIVDRDGSYVDLRGPIVREDPEIAHRSSFSLSPAALMAAIHLLDPTGTTGGRGHSWEHCLARSIA